MNTNLYLLPGRQPVSGPNSPAARTMIREAVADIRQRPETRPEVIGRLQQHGFVVLG